MSPRGSAGNSRPDARLPQSRSRAAAHRHPSLRTRIVQASFNRLSLAQRFLLVSFPILLAGTLVICWWISGQIEESVVGKVGGVTALYVDSFVAPRVQTLTRAAELSATDRQALKQLLDQTVLGKKLLSLKVWRPDGMVLFSSVADEIGRKFPIDAGLAVALRGEIFSEITDRSESERAEHGSPKVRVIETYTPIHADGRGSVIAAAEFYQSTEDVDRQAAVVLRRSWGLVTLTSLAMYLLLFIVVHGGSRTIARHERELQHQVSELTRLSEQNAALARRVQRAGERTTELNETFLQRVSADIHDGPGQDIGFALMQLRNLGDACPPERAACAVAESLPAVRIAVESALKDLKAISAGLQMPDLEPLSLADVARRAVRDFHSKTGAPVDLAVGLPEIAASTHVKIAVYRLLQEALANSYRHAAGAAAAVRIAGDASEVRIEVSDGGPGFETTQALQKGRLGISGMRQRAELLGGAFELDSEPGRGTCVRVTLPHLAARHDAA